MQIFFNVVLLVLLVKSMMASSEGIIVDHFVQGTINQGSYVFPDSSRGKQCVANAFMSCVFRHISEKPLVQWTTDDIDNILVKGDSLYRHAKSHFMSEYLEPREVSRFVCIEGQKVKSFIADIYSGDISNSFVSVGEFYSLELALPHCLNGISHAGILVCNNSAVAVHSSDSFFHVFDSHARGNSGQSCSDGYASMFSVHTAPQLLALLRYIFGSKNACAFDLHKVQTVNVNDKRCFLQTAPYDRICFSKASSLFPCITCELVPKRKAVQKRKAKQEKTQVCETITVQCVANQNQLLSNSVIHRFHNSIKSGPDFVCKCCFQTWFRESVCHAVGGSVSLRKKCNISPSDWVCRTCYSYLKIDKIPPCSILNGMKFPSKPPELDLTQLEERLVAPRIPFMQLREKPRGGQLSITGNVVNVPADVSSTVKKLPRLTSEDETIALKFKRSLSFKHNVAFERIRPGKVISAARWLVGNSELFKNEGIDINEDWLQTQKSSENEDEELSNSSCTHESVEHNKSIEDFDNVLTRWSEETVLEDRPTGNMDTVLQDFDFREYDSVLSVAPGEKNSPLSIFQDKNSEFLSFPTIYCGQTRPDNSSRQVPIHYSTICKWELRNVDRRSATCIPNIFFKTKKLQIKYIQDKVALAVRKCKLQGKKYTVADLLNPNITDSLVRLNEGYHVLRTLRGSPPYWEKAKKDIFAMIRQLGIPTWFCSFSAAETKWSPLLITLGKLIEQKQYSDADVANLNWDQKCKLIKADPVTCARYFDYRFQRFLSEVLLDPSHPIGEVIDYFYRVEFQQRGSPHVHMLLWVKNAPNTDANGNDDVTKFIDKHVVCSSDGAESFLVNYQTHRHARTCMKKNKPVCRFNFPIPPMPKTAILYPIEEKSLQLSAKKNYDKVAQFLNSDEFKETSMSFPEFLSKIDLDLDSYILSVRAALTQPKVFLRREPNETRINSYNSTLLTSWEANMDIQYILDPYACAAYIVSYVSKGQRGMSNLLNQACEEAKQIDSDIRKQVRHIGNKFLTNVEVGAQEAAYLVLQMPLRRSTRSVIFINTSPPEKRVVMLKPKHILEDMKMDSTQVESGNAVSLYQQRPKSLDSLCLADFVSNFSVKYQKGKEKKNPLTDDLLEIDYEDDTSDYQAEQLEDLELAQTYIFRNGTEICKRKRPSILRWVHFDIETEMENHYRELLMLFKPWRKEDDFLKTFHSYEESYMSCKLSVERKRKQYEQGAFIVNEIENIQLIEDDCYMDHIAPENEHQETIDLAEKVRLSDEYGCFDPGKNAPVYDLGVDLGISRKQIDNENLSQLGEMNDTSYRELVRVLNQQQKEFFLHVLHWLKVRNDPIYIFLTGGAGVGKSMVTRALYQALLKFYSHQLHANPDHIRVLLCAPTGMAAHNISGNTVHSAFCLPVNQGFSYKPLDMQQLNTMRSRYMNLTVLFIDEISMVGRGMFNFINLRLQEIKSCKKPFGGVSVVCVGDLFQLKPVMDGWIFSQSMTGYGPLASNLWKDNFSMFELREVMRQKDDRDFAFLLNRLREGSHTELDLELLNRKVTNDCPQLESVPHLFTTRREVDEYNEKVFEKADLSSKVIIDAIDWVLGSVRDDVKVRVLARVPKDSSKTMGLSEKLKLVINIPAEVTCNVDVKDGVTNGASCIIKKFDYRVQNSIRVSIIWVVFDDERIGQNLRTGLARLYCTGIDKNWTPILEITRVFTIKMNNSFQVKRRQFPLRLAAAKTIHKAQGSTMHQAVIHFGNRKNDHIHYVGLSQVTSLQNVHLLHLNDSKISVCSDVLEEMERLRYEANVSLSLENLALHPLSSTKMVFFNIRSLHCHFADLKNDFNLMSCDIIALSETRLTNFDQDEFFQLPGFTLHRFDFPQQDDNRSVYGLAFYLKNTVSTRNLRKHLTDGVQFFSVEVASSCHWVTIVLVYLPPKLNAPKAKECLRKADIDCSAPVVLAGDMNFDSQKSSSLTDFILDHFGLQYLETPCTTDYDSTLDYVFTNVSLDEINGFGTLESHYSDHKPVFVSLK